MALKRLELASIKCIFFIAFCIYNVSFFNILDLSASSLIVNVSTNKHDNEIQKNSKLEHLLSSSIFNQTFSVNSPPFGGKDGRLVLMLIDALRYDFIFETFNSKVNNVRMPFVSRLIREKAARPFKLNARPPTVTMPRLKSLVGGIIPEFIDVLWNFNTTYLVEDNLLRQFRRANKSIVFYGDDTWLKLFNSNDYFLRHDGVTSFIASDYDEVDFNISRHLSFEMSQQDWSFLILHYLGLDHVGHIEGPFAPINIKRKLFEMDEVIRKLYNGLNVNDLLIVLSDHGMANEGGHGGSSHHEITTPALFITKNKQYNTYLDDQKLNDLIANNIKTYDQIDLVSTLSCLFDLQVPLSNKGVTFIRDLFDSFELNDANYGLFVLECLEKNLRQLNEANKIVNEEFLAELKEVIEKGSHPHINNIDLINTKFEKLMRQKMELIIRDDHKNQQQSYFLILAMLIMLICWLQVISSFLSARVDTLTFKYGYSLFRIICFLILVMSLSSQFLKQIDVTIEYWSLKSSLMQICIWILLIQLDWLLIRSDVLSRKLFLNNMSLSLFNTFYIFASILYIMSLFSSSFIEEEHQIWYFLDITQIYLLIIAGFGSCRVGLKCVDIRKAIQLLLLIATTRILRSINQTGNKWIHLKDIGDVLRENESKIFLVFLAFCCLMLINYLTQLSQQYHQTTKYHIQLRHVYFFIVFIYHATINFELIQSLYYRNLIAQFAYALLLLNFLLSLLKINMKTSGVLYSILAEHWIFLNCLIQSTHNLLVIFLWNMKGYLLKNLIKITMVIDQQSSSKSASSSLVLSLSFESYLLFNYIVSKAGYFTQGNSNGLNTIQVSSGFVGVNEINRPIIGFLMFCSTYSSFIYWFFVSMDLLSLTCLEEAKRNEQKFKKSTLEIKQKMTYFKSIASMTIFLMYTISAYFQRQHLFVWSVFAPKLIYDFAFFICEIIIIILIQVLI